MLDKLYQFLTEDHGQSEEEIQLIEWLWTAVQPAADDPDLEIPILRNAA